MPFRVRLSEASALEPSGLPTTGYADDVADVDRRRLPPMLDLDPDTGFASVAVVASAYYRAAD
jgi:hypothetical protein